MNDRDQKQLDKQLRNPEFVELYHQFFTMRFELHSKILVTAKTPTEHDMKTGHHGGIYAAVRPALGQTTEEVQAILVEAKSYADSQAMRLSAFFPEDKRWHWQQIFVSQFFGGSGTVEQRHKGGRKKQNGISKRTAERYERIAVDFWKSRLSVRKYCDATGTSQATINRAVQYCIKKTLRKSSGDR